MLLMIDNYDSFTWNVVQYLGELKADVKVIRNDELTVDEIIAELRGTNVAERAGRAQDAGRGMEMLRKKGYM